MRTFITILFILCIAVSSYASEHVFGQIFVEGGLFIESVGTDWCSDANNEGCWRFNTASGQLTDESTNDNTATNTDAVNESCEMDECFAFNGSTAYLDTNYAVGTITDFSWGARIRMDDTPGSEEAIMGVFDPDGTYQALIQADFSSSATPNCRIREADGSASACVVTATGDITTAAWHRVDCVFDKGTSLKIYVDGVENNSQTTLTNCNGTISLEGQELYVGARNFTTKIFFDGKIDEVSIFDRVLSDADVLDMYNNGLNE